MNLTLLKATAKSNWIILVIFFAVMLMYITSILAMFNPEDLEALKAMIELMPQAMAAAMGYDVVPTNLTSMLALYYYDFIAIMFPLIYCIIMANRLVAKHVERGSMAYLLSTPNSRLQIVSTQGLYLLLSITILFSLVTISGISISEGLYAGQLNIGSFIYLNFVASLTFFAVSGICFFFSCIFDDTKYSFAFGAGIPILFFVIRMLSNVSDNYNWIGNLSLFSLFKPHDIVSGEPFTIAACFILAGIAAALYIGGIIIFDRRDLPL